MADRAYMYCPYCRNQGNARAELLIDNNTDFHCLMGHRAPRATMMALQPEMIPTEVHFKPGPNDVKAEIWVNSEVLMQAKEKLGQRFHPTIASLIRCCMAGEPVVIDGQQAAELRKLNVKNGAEMVAVAKLNNELAGQVDSLTEQLNRWETRFSDAMAGAK